MVKVVAFFNHKGGVGKTTILFNVAIALAQIGKKVVLFDADSQANLTALAVTEKTYQQALDEERTIWSALEPLVTGAGDFKVIEPLSLRNNLWLIPGDIRLADFEGICPTGWTEALAGEARGFRVSTALYRLFQETATNKSADFVLIDLIIYLLEKNFLHYQLVKNIYQALLLLHNMRLKVQQHIELVSVLL